MNGNVITANFRGGRTTMTAPLWQYDYGQVLRFTGVSLPETYEVHFSNAKRRGDAKTAIGDANGVVIPDEFLATGDNVYAWIFLHATQEDGETEYMATIPVNKRATPSDEAPTPQEQSAITQAIAALNSAVVDVQEAVEAADSARASATSAGASATAAAASEAGVAEDADRASAAATAAESAQGAAEAAQAGAETAQTGAESARDEAAQASAAQIAQINATGAAVLESIPEDYTELSADVSNLKSDLSDIIESITPEWEQGGLNISGEISHNKLIRTGFIDVYAVGQLLLSASTSYAYAYYFYDSSQSYVSRNTEGAGSMNVDLPSGIRYVRFVFFYSGVSQNITPSYGENFKITLKKKTEYDVYPTFDLTDRAGDINAVLAKKSICRIAPGDYYIDVFAPYAGSEIIGCGNNTRLIRKSDSTYNYMIRLKQDSALHNLTLVGSTSDITVGDDWDYYGSPAGICAIRIDGTGSDDTQRFRISVKDIKISSFAGSGIYVSKTGYHPEGCCCFENIFIRNCNAGITFGSYAEFHRIIGLRANECYYGCVNNGGNNVFTNCDFSANIQGLLMDNSSGNFNNSSHGAFVGCSFNHSDSNNGVAIELNTMVAGEMFSGCSIFYGKIILTTSQGIVFNACNFGSATPIKITNGGGVQFANCMFRLGQSAVTDNRPSKTHFDNCYYLNGTAVDSVPQ